MKKFIDSKVALEIMIEAAKNYDEKLNNKHFLIVYQAGGSMKNACVGFRDMNFLHLTGVKTKLSAQQFYSACLSGKLSEKDCPSIFYAKLPVFNCPHAFHMIR